jgi:hypothetical protein
MPRPFLNHRIEGLEVLVDQNSSSETLLGEILLELQYRKSRRAKNLQQCVEGKLAQIAQGTSDPEKCDSETPRNIDKETASTLPVWTQESSRLTDEQRQVIRAFSQGKNLKVNAFAGAGKTSTLVELGRSTAKRGLYLSFNKRNADEAKVRFPHTVDCRTTHSLASRAVRHEFGNDKLFTKLTSALIQQQMNLEPIRFTFVQRQNEVDHEREYKLNARQVASIVGTAIRSWLYTAHPEVCECRISMLGSVLNWPKEVQVKVETHVRQLCIQCWQKMIDPSDPLPLSHDGYVKYWALGTPQINASFVLLDEAQDTNPVILDVLQKQKCQIVYVGDRHQQIYEWRGAVNAMETITTEGELRLSQSFRFGNAIAELANKILRQLGETVPLRGLESVQSRVGETIPQAILARTNSSLISRFMDLVIHHKRVAIQGGTGEQLSLLNGLLDIQQGRGSDLPELLGIANWDELRSFIETDEGRSLAPLVRLSESHTIQKLIDSLRRACQPEDCDILLSTLHKAKGLEWDRVELLSDFAPRSTSKDRPKELDTTEELRILYVAITRAKLELQIPDDVAQYIETLGKPHIQSQMSDDAIVAPPRSVTKAITAVPLAGTPARNDEGLQSDQRGRSKKEELQSERTPSVPSPPRLTPVAPQLPVQGNANKGNSQNRAPEGQGCLVLLAGIFFAVTVLVFTAFSKAF